MVAREFQSYTSKRSVDFVNAVDVVDEAEQPRSRRGGQDVVAKREKKRRKKIHCPRRYSVEAVQDAAAAAAWGRQKIRCGGGSRYATQWKLMTKMPPPPGRRGTRCRSRAAAWKEGDKTEPVEDSRCWIG